MYESESKATIDQIEKKVAMQMITFSIVIIILIITLVSFIRIYSNKEERILKDMQTEAILLETVITDHLNYSRYFVNMIGTQVLTKIVTIFSINEDQNILVNRK